MNSDELFPLLMSASALGVVVGLMALWLYALVSALNHERLDSTMKLAWVIVIIFVPLVGALIYFFAAPRRPTGFQFALAELHHRRHKLARAAGLRPARTEGP
jgi:H+/Cl- antiporter ClcA